MTQTLPRRIPGASGHRPAATPLAEGDQVILGHGHTVWTVTHMPAGREWTDLVRLRSGRGAIRKCSWLRVEEGYLERCNGVPVAEYAHA